MSLSNKVAIVTGASSGIGAATAVLFAKEGAKVVVVGRNEANLKKVTEECSQVGDRPLIITADLTITDEAINVVKKTVEVYGQLDILINNAGIWRVGLVGEEGSYDIYDELLNTNLKAVVVLTNIAVPHLIKTKGNIVNISSVLGKKVLFGYSIYCAAKAGLDHYSRTVASELAHKGVRVNIVSPGPVKTNLFEGDHNISWDILTNLTAMKKVSQPQEIAELIAFVASEKAGSITGADFVVDCGSYVKTPCGRV